MQTASAIEESQAGGHQFDTMTEPVTAAAELTEIATYDVRDVDFVFLAVTIGVEALTQWQFLANGAPASVDVDISSTTGAGLSYVTAGLDTLAVGTHGVGVNVQGIAELTIKCKSALGTATVLLEAGVN